MTRSTSILVEACVATPASALAAVKAGAHRLELCDNLVEGGTTPSLGLVAVVRARVTVPVHVLIRPRGGDFLYDGDEIAVMLRDIELVREAGADGVVLGALTTQGEVDDALTLRLAAASHPMDLTFHRAFDLVREPFEALDTLVALGFDRLLTSGQAPSAPLGRELIASLVTRSGGRIAIMAGGGITEANAAQLVRATGVREIHLGAGGALDSKMVFRRPGVFMGKGYSPDEYQRRETDPARLRAVLQAVGPPGAAGA